MLSSCCARKCFSFSFISFFSHNTFLCFHKCLWDFNLSTDSKITVRRCAEKTITSKATVQRRIACYFLTTSRISLLAYWSGRLHYYYYCGSFVCFCHRCWCCWVLSQVRSPAVWRRRDWSTYSWHPKNNCNTLVKVIPIRHLIQLTPLLSQYSFSSVLKQTQNSRLRECGGRVNLKEKVS